MKKTKPNTPYFSRNLLIEASRLGLKWDYNRQISERIAEVPDRIGTLESMRDQMLRVSEQHRFYSFAKSGYS